MIESAASNGKAAGVGIRRAGWRPFWGDGLFVVAALMAGTARFLILRRGGAPATVDAGNWLAYGDALLGRSVRSSTIVYPPLVPLLTKACVGAFGLTDGVAALGAASSLAPAVGVYLALRALGPAGAALAPAGLVLGAGAVGEAAAWGGFPQLLALGMVPVVLWWAWRLAASWSHRAAVWCGLWLAALFATSHLVAPAAVAALLALVVLTRWTGGPFGVGPWVVVKRLVVAASPSLLLLPVYLPLAAGLFGSSNRFHYLTQLRWSGLPGGIGFLFRDLALVWWPLVLASLAVPFLVRERRHPLWLMTTALLIATALLLASTREGRYLYLLTVVVGLAVGCLADLWMAGGRPGPSPHRARRWRLAAGAAAAAVVLAQLAAGLMFFRGQRDYYGIMTPGLVAAVDRAAAVTGPEGIVGVTSLRDAPLGWWVEALAHRPTIYGAPLRWLAFEDEVARATLANALFEPPFPSVAAMEQAAAGGIEVILLPTSWFFYDEEEVSRLAERSPGAVERFNEDAVLLYPARAGG